MSTQMGTGPGTFTDDELVTGEAVTLLLPAAGLGPRIGGAVLDMLIAYVLLTVVSWAASASLVVSTDSALAATIALVGVVLSLVGYPVACETLLQGKTLGKLAAGTRTVRDDGGAIAFRHALTRGLVGFVETYLFLGTPAVLTALLNARGKRLGDLAAGTYVVRERMGLRMTPPAQMPPALAPWAVGADIAPLPDSLALATRQFIGRAPTLSPGARRAIGEELYTELLTHVAPAPPAGVHPEYVMAAVLTERGRRDAELIRTRDAAARRLLPPDEMARPNPWAAPAATVRDFRADGSWQPEGTFRPYDG